MSSLSTIIQYLPTIWEIFRACIIYNAYIFVSAFIGAYILRKILTLALITLKERGTVPPKAAKIITIYLHIKALLTPIIFVVISLNGDLHKKVRPNENILIDRILLNINGASGILTPERHIASFLMKKQFQYGTFVR